MTNLSVLCCILLKFTGLLLIVGGKDTESALNKTRVNSFELPFNIYTPSHQTPQGNATISKQLNNQGLCNGRLHHPYIRIFDVILRPRTLSLSKYARLVFVTESIDIVRHIRYNTCIFRDKTTNNIIR
jgi:hypothetical protein